MSLSSEVRSLVRDIVKEDLEVVLDLNEAGDLTVTVYMQGEQIKSSLVSNRSLKWSLDIH